MELTLTIMSCCTVGISIPDVLTGTRAILHCSRWVNVLTLTQKTQLTSILSITCNIQHLAQQYSPPNLQCSILQNRTFSDFQWADTANRKSKQPNDIITWMMARVGVEAERFRALGHCAAWDPKRRLRQRSDEKRTSSAMKRKRNGLGIMWREKMLGPESDLKTQCPGLNKSRIIWTMLK